jgi:hypothetical protein
MKWTRDAPKLAGNGSPREARPLIHYYIEVCEVYVLYSMVHYTTSYHTLPFHKKVMVMADCSAEKTLFLVNGCAPRSFRIFFTFLTVFCVKNRRASHHN